MSKANLTLQQKRELLRQLIADKARGPAFGPLDPEQRRFFFMHQLDPLNSEIYLDSVIKVEGPLDVAILQQALHRAIQRRDIFRAEFVLQDHAPVQRWATRAKLPLDLVDLSSASAAEQAAQRQVLLAAQLDDRPIDLASAPLARATLLIQSDRKAELLVRLHHLITDIASLFLVLDDISRHYAELAHGDASVSCAKPALFRDFVERSASRARESVAAHRAYWEGLLEGVPHHLELPVDFPRPAQHSLRAGFAVSQLPSDLTTQVLDLSRENAVTPYVTFLLALQLSLHLASRQQDFTVGIGASLRDQLNLHNLAGPASGWMLSRAQLSSDRSFTQLGAALGRQVLNSYEHLGPSMEDLLRWSGALEGATAARNPLFQVMFDFFRAAGHVQAGEVKFSLDILPWRHTHFDIVAFAHLDDGCSPPSATLAMTYYSDVFSERSARWLIDTYRWVLEYAVRDPGATLATLTEAFDRSGPSRVVPQKVLIVSSFTAQLIDPSLTFWLRTLGVPHCLEHAPYNQVFQQLLHPESELANNRNGFNVLLVRPTDWPDPKNDTTTFVDALGQLAARGSGPVLVVVCPSEHDTELGKDLAARCAAVAGIVAVGADEIDALYPLEGRFDEISRRQADIPYTAEYFSALGTIVARRVSAARRPPTKVIACDCDNTLWQGVVAEDGPEGIVIDDQRAAIQRFLLAQREAGVLLCLCSKNEQRDVLAAFAAHPEQPLKAEHVTALRVNWSPKSVNLRSLAEELNLGLDSFVFIDDNPLECAEVEAACPEVAVARLPLDSTEALAYLRHFWPLDPRQVTADDASRAEMYAAERQRREVAASNDSLSAFYATLELEVDTREADDDDLKRVSSLTLRTNQFNTTTRRRPEMELRDWLRAANRHCYVTRVKDRFGSYGLVGVLLVEERANHWEVDSMLLSCRALGRGVEHQMVATLARVAQQSSCASLHFPLIPSERNAPARQFLHNLTATRQSPEAPTSTTYLISTDAAAELSFSPSALCLGGTKKAPAAQSRQGAATPGPSASRPWHRIAAELRTPAAVIAQTRPKTGRSSRRNASASPSRPLTNLERQLAALWAEALELDNVGPDDDYFALGGDSIRLVALVSQATNSGLQLDIIDILEHPTVAGLAAALAQRDGEARPAGAPKPARITSCLESVDPKLRSLLEDAYPLAGMQEVMIQQYNLRVPPQQAPRGVYHFQQCAVLHDQLGAASSDALCEALQQVGRFSPPFRMRLAADLDNPGRFLQGPCRPSDLTIGRHDLKSLTPIEQHQFYEQLKARDLLDPLSADSPANSLLRLHVLELGERRMGCVVFAHHAISDGFSFQNDINATVERYVALAHDPERALPTVPSGQALLDTYRAFVAREHATRSDPTARQFWQARLEQLDLPAAPADAFCALPNHNAPKTCLDAADGARLTRSARGISVSARALYLSAFAQLVAKVEGCHTPTIGVVFNGRTADLPHALQGRGLFWNIMPIGVPLQADKRKQTRGVQAQLNQAESYASYSLRQLQLDLGRTHLFNASFNFFHNDFSQLLLPDTPVELEELMFFDRYHPSLNLTVMVNPHSHSAELHLTFSSDYISVADAEALLADYLLALRQIANGV